MWTYFILHVPLIKYGATSSEETFYISNSKKKEEKKSYLNVQITSSCLDLVFCDKITKCIMKKQTVLNLFYSCSYFIIFSF